MRLSDLIGQTSRRVGLALSWLFLLATAITCYEVVMRYVFQAPTTWAHAVTTFICAAAFMVAGAYSEQRHEHIRITAIYDRLRVPERRLCDLLAYACGIVFLGGLGYGALWEAVDSLLRFDEGRWRPETLGGAFAFPLPAFLRGILFLSVLLFLLQVLVHLGRKLRGDR
jgi:TRAP-type mannitol/chloroaromatic compound transport system permease small subunit